MHINQAMTRGGIAKERGKNQETRNLQVKGQPKNTTDENYNKHMETK